MVEKTTGNILFEGSFELTIKCKVDEKEDRMRWRFPLGFLKHKDFSDKRTTTPLTKPTLKSEVGEKEDRMRKILPRKIFEHKDFSDKGTTTTSTEPTLKSEVEEKEDRMRWRLAGTNFELEEREDMMSRILRRGILEHRGTTTASTEPTLKFEEDVRQPPIARPPSPVDKSLSDDVKAWKKIRSETIPRLERLERELRSANENIKTARTVRNWTIGLSLFGSFLLAPFTGGGSFAAAAAISGGTTGVLYIIEMCIEKDVLKTTQEGINRDKAETIRLRTRITSYQGGHKRTEEFVHDLGGIALDAIFQLSQNPLLAFIVSFVDNNSMSLLKAVDQVISLRIQLDRELRRVEEVEGRFY